MTIFLTPFKECIWVRVQGLGLTLAAMCVAVLQYHCSRSVNGGRPHCETIKGIKRALFKGLKTRSMGYDLIKYLH